MEKYFQYLDQLRESGVVNMLGAVPYLQRRFPELYQDKARARSVLMAWIDKCRNEGDAR